MTPEELRDAIAAQVIAGLTPIIQQQVSAAMDVILSQANQQAAQTAAATVSNSVQSMAQQVAAQTQAQITTLAGRVSAIEPVIQAVRSGNAAYDPDIYGGG